MADEENDNSKPKIDLDKNLSDALDEGEAALLRLMDQLKEFVAVVSEEYRNCINKQIEITDKAMRTGNLDDAWDELPHYRSLASQLLKELHEYRLLFDTIGQMAKDRSLDDIVLGGNENMNLVSDKYKELEVLVKCEFEKNKRAEKALLEKHCESILYGSDS